MKIITLITFRNEEHFLKTPIQSVANITDEVVCINDKSTEIPIGVSCRTCDRLDCSQRAFPPLHKKFDIDINTRGVSVYVTDESSQGKS